MTNNKSLYDRYTPLLVPDTEEDQPVWLFVFNKHYILAEVVNDKVTLPIKTRIRDLKFKILAQYYLGKFDGSDCYLLTTDEKDDLPEGLSFKNFRSLLGHIDEELFMLAGKAYQIQDWDTKSQYCGRCGSPNEMKPNELAKICPRCRNIMYPRISPAVIVGIIKGNEILLAQSKFLKENNLHSILAGFVEPGETFEDCVKREVFEEVGLKVKNLRYFGSQPWPFPDSLMVGFTAEYESGTISIDGDEITTAGWFTKDNMPNTPPISSIAGKIINWFLTSN